MKLHIYNCIFNNAMYEYFIIKYFFAFYTDFTIKFRINFYTTIPFNKIENSYQCYHRVSFVDYQTVVPAVIQ